MSGDREFKQPALAIWERVQAERDEWKARAEKAVTERDEWMRRTLHARIERDQLAEQLQRARELLADLLTAASIDGRYDWQPVERFLRGEPVACSPGESDKTTTREQA